MKMAVIDAHQHFWQYDSVKHAWINDTMSVIQQSFLPTDLFPVLTENKVDGCIAVQADQSLEETDFLLQLSNENDFIKGVVGWVDIMDENLEQTLQHYLQYPLLKGFRHILQSEAPEFMLQPNFLNGINLLQKFGYTYDVLIFPHQLKAAIQLVQQFPAMKFVIDHLAKPQIKKAEIDNWKIDIVAISKFPNVYCKISGMVTEADWKNWTMSDFVPYLDITVEAFGTNRIMFGSDWPVCLVASSYEQWISALQNYFANFSELDKAAIFGQNAIEFYNLK